MKKPPEVVEVPITLSDIENGRSHSPTHCPIGLACNRLDSRHTWAICVTQAARIDNFTDAVDYYSLGVAADKFVHAFDKGEDVQPQTVVLHHSPGAVVYLYGNDNQSG